MSNTEYVVENNEDKNKLTFLKQSPKIEMCIINSCNDIDIKFKIKELLSTKFNNSDPYKNFVDLCNHAKELIDDKYNDKIAYGILDVSQKINVYINFLNNKIQLNFSEEKKKYLIDLQNKEINKITNDIYKNSINCLKILYYLDCGLNYNYYYLFIETIPILILNKFSTLNILINIFLKILKFVIDRNS